MRSRASIRHVIRGERGSVVALVAICLVVLLGVVGLALDAGRGYLARAELARAVDAGTLGGARILRQGENPARQRALDLAALNGAPIVAGTNVSVAFGENEFGEQTVRVDAIRRLPTMLMRILGVDTMTVRAVAEAAIPPVDLVLVLDQSASLVNMGAWDDLLDAAEDFVEYFDDDIDKLGLTSFQLRGTERVFLRHGFTNAVENALEDMNSAGDTNPGEGLRLALEQLTSAEVRDRSAKVVVFFTDGRPTAFRGNIGGRDRMLAIGRYSWGGWTIRGYFNNPDNLPTDAAANPPSGCSGDSWCFGWNVSEIREEAQDKGLEMADAVRAEGMYVYSIGLGNPAEPDPLLTPDLDYLDAIANVDGVSNPNQPQGNTYFAPSANELRAVFNQVAQDLLIRLAQ